MFVNNQKRFAEDVVMENKDGFRGIRNASLLYVRTIPIMQNRSQVLRCKTSTGTHLSFVDLIAWERCSLYKDQLNEIGAREGTGITGTQSISAKRWPAVGARVQGEGMVAAMRECAKIRVKQS